MFLAEMDRFRKKLIQIKNTTEITLRKIHNPVAKKGFGLGDHHYFRFSF